MFHLLVLASNIVLAHSMFFGVTLALQVIFYAAAILGFIQRKTRRRIAVFSAPCAMCLLLWATIVGFYRFITHRQQVTWERVPAPAQRDVAA
jgi:hypothetical protein